MYWNETIETMDTERLRALQDERLREQVRYTYDRVPFYKKMFDDAGAQPGDIRTAEGSGKAAVHFQDRPARQLPLRAVRRADGRARAHPRLLGHDGTSRPSSAIRRTIVDDVGRVRGARADLRRRRHAGRHRAGLLRLRPVHRRTRACTAGPSASARRSSPRRPATPRGRSRCCRITGRRCSAARRRTRSTSARRWKRTIDPAVDHPPQGRPVRRRAVDAGDEAQRNRKAAGHQGL